MNTVRQFLGGIVGGAIVIALIAGGVLLSAGDAAIALLPTSTLPPETPQPSPTPTPRPDTPTVPVTPTDTPTLVPTGACPRPAGWIDYVVGPGDDLAAIAGKFNIDVVLLQVNNCLNDPAVLPGQIIFVPPLQPTATLTLTPAPTLCGPPLGWQLYIVRPGDTLSSIARATGTTIQQLKLANCLDTDQIKAGQRLFVPRQPFPTPTRMPIPTFTPTPTPSGTATTSSTPTTAVPTIGTPTDTPTPTSTGTPSDTPTPIVIQTPTPTIEVTPTATPSTTPTETIPPTATVPPDTPTSSPTPP